MRCFAVEREGAFIGEFTLVDENKNIAFADLMEMSYDEMKEYDRLEEFVVAIMDATNQSTGGEDDDTFVTLVDNDGSFIWSVLIGPGDNDDEFKFATVDFKKDGKTYKYAEN